MRTIVSRRPDTFWWSQPEGFRSRGCAFRSLIPSSRRLAHATCCAVLGGFASSNAMATGLPRLASPRGLVGGDLIAWARNQLTGDPELAASDANLDSKTRLGWPCHLKRHARHRLFQPVAFSRATVCLVPRGRLDFTILPNCCQAALPLASSSGLLLFSEAYFRRRPDGFSLAAMLRFNALLRAAELWFAADKRSEVWR